MEMVKIKEQFIEKLISFLLFLILLKTLFMIYNNTQLYIIIKLKKETINKPIKKMFLWANKMDVNILKMLKRIIVLKIYKVSYE